MLDNFAKLLPQLIEGAGVTFGIFAVTLVLSLPLGFIVSLMRISRFRVVRFVSGVYIWIMRGSPLILQLVAVYYGLVYVGITLENYQAAGIAFVLNYAAYLAEIFRGGIQSIPEGQYEASRVLGLSNWQTMLRVVMPQALKRSLPAIGNEANILVKDSALLYAIGMSDVLRVMQQASIRTFSFQPFILALLFYLLFTFLLERGWALVEKRFGYKE